MTTTCCATAPGTCSGFKRLIAPKHDGHLERCARRQRRSGPAKHPLLRRWDHKEGDPTGEGLQLAGDGAALIIEGSDEEWLSLEDGVHIRFQVGPPASTYRTGDYWLIPARTATADVEWPREPAKDSRGNPVIIPVALPPAGVQHHDAPLAVVTLTNGTITLPPTECRQKFNTVVGLTPQ